MRLRMREGAAGYGVYWMLLEMLRDCPDYRVFYFPESFAFSLNITDVDLVCRVCKDYDLFEFDSKDTMSSPWLDEAMGEYDERKKKLQEAGRRGAAHRWKGLSLEDSKPIALDAIPYNVTQDDFTLPSEMEGKAVGDDYVDMLSKTQPEGHAPAYIAQVCLHYGMKEATCEYICEHSDNASLTNVYYQRFCTIVKRIQQEKWVPKHPDAFFIKKVFA